MTPERLLPRRRLVAPLATALEEGRIALVRGGAGSGKSTLLTLLASELDAPVSRLVLGEADRELTHLLRRLRDLLELPLPDESLEGGAPAATAVLRSLPAGAPFLLALDDLHVLGEDGATRNFLRLLVEGLPGGAKLVLLTRGALPLPVGALQARDRLHEIRSVDLELSRDETRELARLHAPDQALPGPLVERLREVTGGWLVAVMLFARSLGERDPERALAELAAAEGRLSEFLADAVLDGLDAETVSCLEKAAVLEPFGRDLLSEVCGRDADAALRSARRQHLLVPGPESSLAFSGLLGDVIRSRLRERPEEWRAAQRAAAEARRGRGEHERAIEHMIEAGDPDAAAATLLAVGFGNLRISRLRRLGPHLERLGEDRVSQNPLLRFLRATVLLVHPETARRARTDFEALARLEGPPELVAVARTRLAYLAVWQGDMEAAAKWSRSALELARPLPDPSAVYCHAIRGYALLQLGRGEEAREHEETLAASPIPFPESATVDFYRAWALCEDGAAEEALKIALDSAARLRSDGRLSAAALLMPAARAALERGALREAVDLAQEGIQTAILDDEPWWAVSCRVDLAAAWTELGNESEARREAARAADEAHRREMHGLEVEARLVLARVAVDRGVALETACEAARRTQSPLLGARLCAELARRALDDDCIEDARQWLDEAENALGGARARARRAELGLLRARLCLARGEACEADRHVAANLLPGPALRAERPHLVPSLLRLAADGNEAARREILAAGRAALPTLRESEGALAARLRETILDEIAGPLDVQGFGTLRVVRRSAGVNDGEEVGFRTPRVADLFRLLLLRGRERPLPQEAIVESLWPDAGRAGVNRLHSHVSYLRRSLEPEARTGEASHYVLRDGDGYVLDLRGGRFDADVFESDVRAGLRALAGDPEAARQRLEEALGLHHASFFGDRPEIEGAEAARARLARLHVEGRLAAARLARADGDALTADEHLEVLLAQEPGLEDAWRLRMEVALDRGRPDRVRALLGECRRALREELDAEPSEETLRLAKGS